jgi:hypothetical protein
LKDFNRAVEYLAKLPCDVVMNINTYNLYP